MVDSLTELDAWALKRGIQFDNNLRHSRQSRRKHHIVDALDMDQRRSWAVFWVSAGSAVIKFLAIKIPSFAYAPPVFYDHLLCSHGLSMYRGFIRPRVA